MEIMRKSAGLLAVIALILTTVLCGCGGDDEKSEAASANAGKSADAQENNTALVGVMLYNAEDVYVDLVNNAIQKTLADQVRVEVFDAKINHNVQVEQIDKALDDGAKCLIVNLADIHRGAQMLDKATRKNTPVVLFNREPDSQLFRIYSELCYVGTNAGDAGKMQGDILKELWAKHPEYDRNKNGKLDFILLQGPQDNPEALARTEFSVRQAIAGGVPLQQVGGNLLCRWERDLARESVGEQIAIADGVTFELVIANNDAMALGAVDALQESGYNLENGDPQKFIPVIGVDAVPDAVDAIDRGIMSATVKQDAEAMGDIVAKIALNKIAGKDFLDGIPYKFESDELRIIRIPYAVYGGK